MKIRSLILGAAAGGCALGAALPQVASATVSDEAFNGLTDMVNKQGQMLEELKKTHEQDQQKIQQLQEQLGQTQMLATNAAEKAEAASQAPAVYTAPTPATSTTHNFIVTGDAEAKFGKSSGQNPTFALADFAPIFLFRANDDTLFEAGFDTMLSNNRTPTTTGAGETTSINLSFAQLDYTLNDYVTFVTGEMLLPLGTYNERGAGWINKIPDDPLIHAWLPGSGLGAQLRGAWSVGQSGQMLTYSIYGVNGPSSSSATGTAFPGDLDLAGNVGSSPNWHDNPSGGGRIGWFIPWAVHYDLELGISGQSGEWSDDGSHLWSAGVLDFALHLGPYLEAKGEYINTWVGTDAGNIHPQGVWVQGSYKLAGLKQNLPLINNAELVARYDNVDDSQGTRTDRYTVGCVYYLSNTLQLKGDYEFLDSHGPNALPPTLFVVELSYGL